MRDKWDIKKKGDLKIHISVNVKSKEILSMRITADEHVHDSKVLSELVVDDVIKFDGQITVGKLFADDGAYDGNDIFRCLEDNGILPCIKVRKNARIKLKTNHILRNFSVLAQRNDLQGWKKVAL